MAGDSLVLFSDGVTESCGEGADEEFGEERLGRIVCRGHDSAAGLIADINCAIAEFTRNAPATDDVTLVALRLIA